jgi:hypothetical protein
LQKLSTTVWQLLLERYISRVLNKPLNYRSNNE